MRMDAYSCLFTAFLISFSIGPTFAGESGSSDWTFQSAGFEILTTQDIVYTQAETRSGTIALTLDLYRPAPDPRLPETLPAMLVIHGGGFTGGTSRNPKAVEMCRDFAARGYVCLSINYRLQGDLPHGSSQRDAVVAAIRDAHEALAWLRERAQELQIDTNRIVIDGQSAGAVTALYCAYTDIVAPKATVAAVIEQWGTLGVHVDAIQSGGPPLFIVQGKLDPIINYADAVAIHRRAEHVGIPQAFYLLPNAGHGVDMTQSVNGKPLLQHAADFLAGILGYIPYRPQTGLSD
jgi:para-nitrobenzyl esterase